MTTPSPTNEPSTSLSSSLRSTLLPVVVILTVIAGILFWMRGSFRDDHASHSNPATDVSGVPFTGQVGQTTPDFELFSSAKESKRISQVMKESNAHILVVNFWATWCAPCVTEMPSLEKLSQAYQSQGVTVVAVNIDPDAIGASLDKAKSLKVTFPIFHDVGLKLGDLFDLHGLPSTVLIDRRRKILAYEKGERDWFGSDVRGFLEKQLETAKSVQ